MIICVGMKLLAIDLYTVLLNQNIRVYIYLLSTAEENFYIKESRGRIWILGTPQIQD